jgi:hypothetical protein
VNGTIQMDQTSFSSSMGVQVNVVIGSTGTWIWNSGTYIGTYTDFEVVGQMTSNTASVFLKTLVLNGGTVTGSFTVQNGLFFNSGTLQNGVLTVGTLLNIQSSDFKSTEDMIILTLDSTQINIFSLWNLIHSNVTISATSSMFVKSNIFGSYAWVINNGVVTTSGTIPILLDIPILNSGTLLLTSDTTLSSTFTPTPYSTLTLSNVTLTVPTTLRISNGNLDLRGRIICDTINVTSNTGMVRIRSQTIIQGNLYMDVPTTLMMSSKGPDDTLLGLIVFGSFVLKSLFLVKIESPYNPSLGDTLKFFSYQTATLSPTLNMIGATYRNGQMNQDGSVHVIYSYGSADASGYRCTYLGNSKILEINNFALQGQVSLSYTIPKSFGWFGFGFDQNLTLNQGYYFVQSQGQLFQTIRHNASLVTIYFGVVDAFLSESKSIFDLGALYQSINIVLPRNLLESQEMIYFVSGPPANVSQGLPPVHDYLESTKFNILNDPTVECSNFLEPARWEIYQVGSLISILVLYVLLFISCLILWKFQPLRSRGISPHLTLFFLFAQLVMEMRNYFSIPIFQGSLCFYYAFGYYPLQQVCFLVIWIYFIRYFSIINMNENKMTIFQDKTVNKLIESKIKILKATSSPWFVIILLILSYLLVVLVFFISLIPNSFECKFGNLTAIKTIHNILLIFIYLLTLLSFGLDLIGNYKLITQCQWIRYIFNDPYYFRVQILLYIPFMIYSLITEIYTLATTLKYIDIVKNYQVTMTFNTISASILLLIDVVFPLIFTGFVLMKSLKKSSPEGFQKWIEDPEVLLLFTKYCQSEYAIENLAAYLDIQEFKKTRHDPLGIYFKYLNGLNSPMEINVSKKVCLEIYDKLKVGEIDGNIFEHVERTLNTNMTDTFSRFMFSSAYVKLIKNKKIQQELLEK